MLTLRLPPSINIYFRKSAQENVTIDIPLESIKQPEFSFFNFLLSWIVDESPEKVEELGEEQIQDIIEEPGVCLSL